MNKIKAVLFDVDGTLLDTTELIYQAFKFSILKHHRKEIKDAELDLVMGKTLKDCYQLLTKLDEVDHFMKEHQTFQVANPRLAVPYKNTLKTLKKLKDSKIKIGVVSTRHKISLEKSLEVCEILEYLDVVINADDVTHHKPHPEPLEKAIKAVGVKKDEVIMVGDTDIDIAAGKNAGIKTVGVSYGFHGKKIIGSNPDYLINDISEVLSIVLD